MKDQKESQWDCRSYLCAFVIHAWTGHLQREKSYFLWFQSVKSRHIKFVCVAQYPIQCLSGLYRPTTATALSPGFLRRQEKKKRERDSSPKILPHKKMEQTLRGNLKRVYFSCCYSMYGNSRKPQMYVNIFDYYWIFLPQFSLCVNSLSCPLWEDLGRVTLIVTL